MSKIHSIVTAYRRFYRADSAKNSTLPVRVAFDTLRDADRRLFPDRESLAEVIAGDMMHAVLAGLEDGSEVDENIFRQMIAWAGEFLAILPDQAITDPGFVRKPLRDLVESACETLYSDAEKCLGEQGVEYRTTQWAERFGVRREYVLAEIRRGNLVAERVGSRYAIFESENQDWMNNPRRGSRRE